MPSLRPLLILLLGTAPLCAQTDTVTAPQGPASEVAAKSPTPTTPYDPHAALATAFQHLDDAEKDVNRFTYFLDLAMGDVSPRSGRTVGVTTRKYEATYINGLLYMRLLEKDNAPLSGSDLKDEQKRYEKALAKKKKLDAEKRASTDDYSIDKLDYDPASVLTPAYTLTVKAAGLLKGEPTHVIDAQPVPGVKTKSHCTWELRFWVDDKTGDLRRYTADTTDIKSSECVNEGTDNTYIEVGGIPKLSTESALINVQDDRGFYYGAKSRATYSNYRRFGATVTIKTGGVIPPDDASPAPPADAKP